MSETIPKKYVFVEIVEHITELSEKHASVAFAFFLITGILTVTLTEFTNVYWSTECENLVSFVSLIVYIFHLGSSRFVIFHINKKAIHNTLFVKIFSFCITVCAFATILMPTIIRSYYGPCKPGAFFERSEYKGNFFVNVFPPNSKGKNYRVPASIEVSYQVEEHEEHTFSFRVYALKRIEWPNGEISFFDDTVLNLQGEENVTDRDGKEWYVELTNVAVNE